ncbi:MAG: exodeoxyribonuclease VII large subunit [Clostridia bacterium]|nr:exodeoxyribonuclease VII large subunit [Clostridia bacterium]
MYEQLAMTQRSGAGSRGEKEKRILSVSELNHMLALHVQVAQFSGLYLKGQISGFQAATSGHWYFDLKDDRGAVISCAVWRSNTAKLQRPRNGDEIIAYGSINLYEPRGRISFVATHFQMAGQSQLYLSYLALKDKLEKEGLFSATRKRQLPRRPKKIAMVTSPHGAVFHDVCNVARGRDPGTAIVLVPVPVQGSEAAPEIASGIRLAGKIPGVEVIIVGRGGGSMEDLWCFNDEAVVRAIAASPIPVVTGIGHDTDTTLSDFAADVHASTPSHAAEITVFDLSGVKAQIEQAKKLLQNDFSQVLREKQLKLLEAQGKLAEQSPKLRIDRLSHRASLLSQRVGSAMEHLLNENTFHVHEVTMLLDASMSHQIDTLHRQITNAGMRMVRATPEKQALAYAGAIDSISQRMQFALSHKLQHDEAVVATLQQRLNALDPRGVLARGYAFVTSKDHVITKASEAPDRMMLHFQDGSIAVRKDARGEDTNE